MLNRKEEESFRKNIKFHRKPKSTGSSRIKVPYKFLVVIVVAVLITFISTMIVLLRAEELVKQVQVPTRPLPAETILLKDGSTTFVSSLDDYLSTVLPETEASTTGTVSPSGKIEAEHHNKAPNTDYVNSSTTEDSSKMSAPAASQLEREETTPSAALITTTSKPLDQHIAKSELQQEPQAGGGSSHQAGHHNHHQVNSSQKGKIPQHYEVRGLLNVTNDYPLAYSQIICGYVWPLMAVITMFTNLMIVFVLTQNDMRTPTNVVLTAIAIADIIPIIVPVPWFIYLFAMGNEKQVLYPPTACYFYQHSTRSVSEIFYFLSTWLNVLLAVQDYLTACWPQLAKKYCQIRVVVIEVISLTILAFLLNLPQAVKLVFKPVKFFYNGQLTYGCKALQAKWFKELIGEYAALYDDIFTAIIVLFVDGGPAIALVTLTWLLIRQLQRQRIQGHLLMEQARTASKRRRERHRQQEYEASARVMIFVLLAFLAVKMPFATTYTLMIIQSRFEIHFMESLSDFQKAVSLIDLVFVLSYPLNFTIFCCCSKKFRHKCAELLGKCNSRTKTARSRLMHSISGSLNSDTLSIAHGNYKRDSVASTVISQQNQRNNSIALPAHSNLDRLEQLNEFDEPHHQHQSQVELIAATRNYQLDKICDGLNHFDLANYKPPKGVAQADLESAEFRASLEDGSLCFECIMRYEQIRSQWLKPTSANRRNSDGSNTSWPSCPPPPPPPIHNAQLYQQLPQIVTTRCDSIRERPSSEEAEGLIGDCVEESRTDEDEDRRVGTSDYSGNSLDQVSMGKLAGQQSNQPPDGHRARESEAGSLSMASDGWRGSEDGSMQNLDLIWRPTPSTHRSSSVSESQSMISKRVWRTNRDEETYLDQNDDQPDEDQRETSRNRENEAEVQYRSREPMRRSERGHSLRDNKWPTDVEKLSDRRFSDRPARKLERTHLRQEPGRSPGREGGSSGRLSSSQGDNKTHAPSLQAQLDGRQRSLSMSNSKLSALASATGLLADIIKSTLLTADTNNGDAQRQSSSVGHLTQADQRLKQTQRRD